MPSTTRDTRLSSLQRLVESEYREMPGLRLTIRQAQKLWGLDSQVCTTVLDGLVEAGILVRSDGRSEPIFHLL